MKFLRISITRKSCSTEKCDFTWNLNNTIWATLNTEQFRRKKIFPDKFYHVSFSLVFFIVKKTGQKF